MILQICHIEEYNIGQGLVFTQDIEIQNKFQWSTSTELWRGKITVKQIQSEQSVIIRIPVSCQNVNVNPDNV
jgi:hypothetical protein